MIARFSIVALILLVGVNSFCQVSAWTESDVIQLYNYPEFNSLVDDWIEFQTLRMELADRSMTDSGETAQLKDELRAFKETLFQENPNLDRDQLIEKIKSFIEKAPYPPDLKQREIRCTDLVWTRITNKKVIENIRFEFPMFTHDQILNMISGKVRERSSEIILRKKH